MEKYAEYKDSGILWIGNIPAHWKMTTIGRLFDIKAGGDAKPHLFSDIQDVDHPYPVYTNTKSAFDVYAYTSLPTCNANTITVTGRGEVGHAIYRETQYDAIIRLLSLDSKLEFVDKKYYTYVIDTIIPFTSDSAAIGQLSAVQIRPKHIPLPPISEQQAIVSFLDSKTAEIDSYIQDKEREIELLAEAKQRIISDAVTKGLNKDVEMKESGIFWWPIMPNNWRVQRLGHILNKENRERPDNAEFLICTNKGNVKKRGEAKIGLIADSDEINQGVKAGDLLIHGMDTWHGAIAVSEYDGMCTPVVHVCTSKENLYFVAYFMQVMAYSKIFKLISNGVRQNTSDFRSWNKVNKIPIVLPSKEEQDKIVQYIQKSSYEIEEKIADIEKEISLISEYRQRIISDVVTGQIKVC